MHPENAISKELALDRIANWKDRGATVELLLTGPQDKPKADLTVRILDVRDAVGDSTLAFEWSTDSFALSTAG